MNQSKEVEERIAQFFSSSKGPLRILKQNNDILYATIKSTITSKFDKKGVFETVWLCLNNWAKVSIQQLRKFLKLNSGKDQMDQDRDEEGLRTRGDVEGMTESEMLMRQNIRDQI